MNESDIEALDYFWATISEEELYIRQHGHYGCSGWEDMWHPKLEDSYSSIRDLLEPVMQRRIFRDLPGQMNPFAADNSHHALMLVLNPPEKWFGNIGVLNSPEYLALKQAAREEIVVVSPTSETDSANANSSHFEDLNDTALTILAAMDTSDPRTLKEIAEKSGYPYDVVRRYSKPLQDKHLIKKLRSRGFIRLCDAPPNCDGL